jgi:hypothetical protein
MGDTSRRKVAGEGFQSGFSSSQESGVTAGTRSRQGRVFAARGEGFLDGEDARK